MINDVLTVGKTRESHRSFISIIPIDFHCERAIDISYDFVIPIRYIGRYIDRCI